MFRVLWLHAAQAALARYWTNADATLRQAITTACHTADQRLQFNPWGEGESRFANLHVLLEAPMAVFYEIHEDDQTVVVLKVRVYLKRKK